jgi:membrane protease YdiL (CAAX protease family)
LEKTEDGVYGMSFLNPRIQQAAHMDFTFPDILTSLTYGSLFLSVLALWFPRATKPPIWMIVLGFGIFFGLLSHRLSAVALIPIAIFGLAVWVVGQTRLSTPVRATASILVLVMSLGFGMHAIPGFDNLKVMDRAQISPDGLPFTLHLNFDKTLVGLFILGLLHQRIASGVEWKRLLRVLVPRAIPLILAIACLALTFGYVRIDPKWPDQWLLWSFTNLLLVCTAEEAFFRGFIQNYLERLLSGLRYGSVVALVIAAILFGIAHFAGGLMDIILASVSGLAYGWLYQKTRRIEASILLHFSLNLTHFLLLTYPALQPLPIAR